jgi:hypothetical protein
MRRGHLLYNAEEQEWSVRNCHAVPEMKRLHDENFTMRAGAVSPEVKRETAPICGSGFGRRWSGRCGRSGFVEIEIDFGS